MKTYFLTFNVGSTRYLVNYHDGKKTHGDGSPFFDITPCRSKRMLARTITKLKREGYTEKP